MVLTIEDEILDAIKLSEKDLLIELSVYLYDKNKLSIGQACKLSKLDRISFQKELAERGVYLKFGVEDFYEDL